MFGKLKFEVMAVDWNEAASHFFPRVLQAKLPRQLISIDSCYSGRRSSCIIF
jgi:hypothetical protein